MSVGGPAVVANAADRGDESDRDEEEHEHCDGEEADVADDVRCAVRVPRERAADRRNGEQRRGGLQRSRRGHG